MDRAGATGPRDVERLGDDPRQVVGIADEVVVLGHRQGDAVDVDLLERVLADEGQGTLPVIATIGTESRSAVPIAGDEVRRAGAGRAHAHADLAGDASVAVGGVGAALFVADEDVPQLRVVAEDVVERQDHAARVAEEDIDALAQERLAQDIGPDPGPLAGAASWSIPLLRLLDGGGVRPCRRRARGCVGRASSRSRRPPGLGGSRRSSVLARHRGWALVVRVVGQTKDPRLPARVLSVCVVRGASARPSAFLRSPAGSR